MVNAQRILDECRAMNSSQLIAYGREHFMTVFNYLTVYLKLPKLDAVASIAECVYICVALDRQFTAGEWNFLKGVFALDDSDYNVVYSRLGDCMSIKIKRDASEFSKRFPYLQRKALISICVAAMCSDGTFTYEDLDFLEDCLLA